MHFSDSFHLDAFVKQFESPLRMNCAEQSYLRYHIHLSVYRRKDTTTETDKFTVWSSVSW